jgi:hypothetical protein
MQNYRDEFCRDEGFDHVSRYVTGLIISPNKTLQGIYDLQVWDEKKGSKKPSRRAMHGAVFETDWGSDRLIQKHREVVALDHRGRGREPWTWSGSDQPGLDIRSS